MPGGGSGSDAQQRALEQFQNLVIPTLGEQEISSLTNEYLGDYSPEMLAAIGMDPSAMEGISLDPRLQDAQMAALDQISQMGETGLLPGEKAALNQARRAAAGEAQAKSAQLLSEFERRGMGGSGAELAARLQAGQSSADRLGQESDRLAQMAQERALSAITQKGNLAGTIRGQEFGEQADIAKAQDAINQFNTANRQQVQAANVGATNQAAMRNLSEKQRIAENNVALKNREQEYNKGLIQQRFQNQVQKAGGTAQQYNQIAQAQQQDAANEGQMWGNIIGAGAQLGGAAMTKKAHGGRVEGKVNKPGNTQENDIIPTMLSPDEIVIPRSHAKDPKKAKSFLDALFESEKDDSTQNIMSTLEDLNLRLSKLEK